VCALGLALPTIGDLNVERAFLGIFLVHMLVSDSRMDLLEAIIHKLASLAIQLIKLEALLVNDTLLLKECLIVVYFLEFTVDKWLELPVIFLVF